LQLCLLKEVELARWQVRLSTGTLYGIIKRLLNDGLIVEAAITASNPKTTNGAVIPIDPTGRQVADRQRRRVWMKSYPLLGPRNLLNKPRTA